MQWGAVERTPEHYEWSGYREMFELAKSMKLKIQVVLSFHACGGNVGDSAQIPLPDWVLEVQASLYKHRNPNFSAAWKNVPLFMPEFPKEKKIVVYSKSSCVSQIHAPQKE